MHDDQLTKDAKIKMADKSMNPKEVRIRLGLNQQEFWGRIGVTQSGGSRYESGRAMPKPVQELLRIVHIDQIDVRKITRGDFEVLSYLKSADPTLYRRLKQQAHTTGALRPSRRRHASA
jgi:transcriptional regulator with XRE-family HTH domain